MYETLASFAQTWGLLLFVALFAGVLLYALWPGNKTKFEAAARQPLEDEPPAAAHRHELPNGSKDNGRS